MAYCAYFALAGDDRIALYDVDAQTGALAWRENTILVGGPSPLAVDPQHKYLYVGLRASRELATLCIEPATGRLEPMGQRVRLPADPCYIRTDRRGRFLLSAYYGAGVVAVHSIAADGAVAGPAVEWIETAPNAHCVQTDPTNRYAFVPHIAGPNVIFQFLFDETTGRLMPNDVPVLHPAPGQGPRHYVFHPTLPMLYFVNEQEGSVTGYRMQEAQGTLEAFQTVSTLPQDFHGKNTCAQIQMHASGRFLYASNRGHDSIACFALDPVDGMLTPLGQAPAPEMPRAFGLDPTGCFLYATSLVKGEVAEYLIDQAKGTLRLLRSFHIGERPMWVMVLQL